LSFEAQELRAVRVVEAFTKPSEDFRFGEPWTGFQRLLPGTLLGSDRVTEIRVSRACYAVLPNDRVAVGEDIIYLAVDA
jgi:succinylglutamate desuccinylase